MEENEQHFQYIMLYYFKKDKNKLAKKKDLCSVCRRFAKCHAGNFSLDNNTSWSSRPAEVDSDQIEMLIENNQC